LSGQDKKILDHEIKTKISLSGDVRHFTICLILADSEMYDELNLDSVIIIFTYEIEKKPPTKTIFISSYIFFLYLKQTA
jgi:hypothetical protein